MKMPIVSRLIFTVLGIFLPIGSHIADYGKTHIFNPDWPPHAKFHTGQTLSFSIALGVCTPRFHRRRISGDHQLSLDISFAKKCELGPSYLNMSFEYVI